MARFKDLTKKEMNHLRKMGCATLASFKNTAAFQKIKRDNPPFEHYEPCYECKNIARKLGLEV